jgi:hypothetical protein
VLAFGGKKNPAMNKNGWVIFAPFGVPDPFQRFNESTF